MSTYTPHKVQEFIVVRITRREAILIQKLRKYAFGKCTVHKMDGLITRIENNISEVIEETATIELGD